MSLVQIGKLAFWVCKKVGVLDYLADQLKENNEFRELFLDEEERRVEILNMARDTSCNWDVDENPLEIAERYEHYIATGEVNEN